MTKNERIEIMNAKSAIMSTISELKYYKRAGWLKDEGALGSAESALEFINKIIKK